MAIDAKRIETRSWTTTYQGPLAIHAAEGFPAWAESVCGDEHFYKVLDRAGYRCCLYRKQNLWGLPLGQVVAVGWLDRVERIYP